MKDRTFMNKASQIISHKEKWATLDAKQMEALWKSIHWKSIEKRVNKLQSRITRAAREGNMGLAHKLQYLLSRSFFAKLLAVRKVTINKGKNTSGIDKRLWSTPAAKFKATLSLKAKGYKARPLRRTYIEKKNTKKKRPLGIPTMYDRAMQALYAMALDPIAEAAADKVSFGFRKKRSIKAEILDKQERDYRPGLQQTQSKLHKVCRRLYCNSGITTDTQRHQTDDK